MQDNPCHMLVTAAGRLHAANVRGCAAALAKIGHTMRGMVCGTRRISKSSILASQAVDRKEVGVPHTNSSTISVGHRA